jgi:methylase of polypeptide subunit release factors
MRRRAIVGVMTGTWPLFDRLADRYDQVLPFFAEFAGQLVGVLSPDPGTRLLDIGSGRGAIAAAAAAAGAPSPRWTRRLAWCGCSPRPIPRLTCG